MNQKKIAVVGLGYVGLPLAVEFGKKRPTVGFDINKKRITELRDKYDRTQETTTEELEQAIHLQYSEALMDIQDCQFYIVTVPTPIDKNKRPDLTPLIKA
ncbi:MAG: Vi polysaccharide biosynthesis UDP-N-acetylglucosamine C-6 dehydrogenase TviB, partial [Bacteroidales bacterium]|nr:Vi polysaccharide biosynthesis UDP-N-acetylglucosamine C-6 dehydrogenase TviB [Bacteroidales bacterium]